VDLDEIAAELYGLPGPEFTPARDAWVSRLRRDKRRDLAAAVKALRRPSAAAEALNLWVRAEPGAVGRLVDLGEQLRSAQLRGSGDDLRSLGRQRREVVSEFDRTVRDLAVGRGRALGTSAEREVAATLEAAVVDPSAAAALGSGQLVRALEHSGIGPVDLEGAVGGTSSTGSAKGGEAPVQSASRDDDSAAIAASRVADAEGAAGDAERALRSAEERASLAATRVAQARDLLDNLERQVAAAKSALDGESAKAQRLLAEREDARELAIRLRHEAEEARRQAGSS
jgi:hypothetical protein